MLTTTPSDTPVTDVHYLLKLAASVNWKSTTAEKLWNDGLDFGEDEDAGRTLWEISDEKNQYILVKDKQRWILHHFDYTTDEMKQNMLTIEIEQIV